MGSLSWPSAPPTRGHLNLTWTHLIPLFRWEHWDTRACVMTVSVVKISAQLGRSHHSFHRQSFPGSTKIWLLSPASDIKLTFLLKGSLFRKHGHSLIFFWSVFLSHRNNAVTNNSWSQLILLGAWEASWTLINDGGTNVIGWKPIEMFGLRTSRARGVKKTTKKKHGQKTTQPISPHGIKRSLDRFRFKPFCGESWLVLKSTIFGRPGFGCRFTNFCPKWGL